MDLSKKETINCPLCHSERFREKYKIDSWPIVECARCNFIYVNPRLEKSELLGLYEENYFDNDSIGYRDYRESRELRKKNFARWVSDAISFVRSEKPVAALDIGCAAGYCLEVFNERGWKPFGVELNRAYAGQLQAEGYKVYNAPLLGIDFEEQYQVITLFDVIEHLTDLREHFDKLNSILADDGIIVLITPDYNSTQRKLLGKKWFQFKPVEHINYFTLHSLTQLAESAGFRIVAHKKAGQYSNAGFLENRLKKYGFNTLLPAFRLFAGLFNLHHRDIYVDTASLYLVLEKNPTISQSRDDIRRAPEQ